MAEKLLLISSKGEDVQFASAVAETAGLDFLSADSAARGIDVITQESPRVIFLDISSESQYQKFETLLHEKVGLFSDQISANSIYFLSPNDLSKHEYLVQSPIFGNYVQKTANHFLDSAQFFGRVIRGSIGERAFDLKRYFPENTRIQTIRFSSTAQKQNGVEAVKNFLIAAQFKGRMSAVIANAVDEILMNAMFDAPVDDLGKHLFSATSRAEVRALSDKSEVEMHVAFDGQYVGISAIDHYGSLDKVKLLSHVSKIYTEEEYRVRTTTAGAGIGLATVFRSGGSLFFASEAHVKTEVMVFFKKVDSFKEFKDQFRFLSTQFYF